ncbi:73566304-e4ed-4fa1-b2ec-2376d408a925 [Sclerotinia trifoliorum]|uniref:73566304-e4ed-4fa1-b2ec-2376d408a925 n=1 Tax=Sclerotinia trifoliorum TaxID=28548 RepID=A0A8H2W435_9HELO|nr:73566304-e4ed-4fa1-b2ec-2376d408a925 [Sclerotinia trifoliorum]
MSGFKDTLKSGWHPKGKDGKPKESWRGDFKGQVAGLVGKGKDPREEALEHQSRPLSSLKDPASFGPPPKSVKYHGAAALPPPTNLSSQTRSDAGGWGAPIPQSEIRAKEEAEEEERRRQEEEAAKPKPPPMPYRANTTGLSIAHLPPPPGRKDGADGRTPPMNSIAGTSQPPSLPPRLPPRQNSNPSSSAPSPPPTYGTATSDADPHKGVLNQGALSRLGAAGISVPGFGIGSTKSKPALPPPAPTRSSTNSSPTPPARTSSPQLPARTSSPQIPARTSSPQLNELQSRFSRLTSSSSLTSSSPKPSPPTEGTTFAQKQAALKTASAFHKDPSSISLSDARSAASTANNFRERHGEQVKSGWASANKLNTKYGIADKVGTYGALAQGSDTSPSRNDGTVEHSSSPTRHGLNGLNVQSVLGKKKPAPPPPPKKRSDLSTPGNATPPPIPKATKPKPLISGQY